MIGFSLNVLKNRPSIGQINALSFTQRVANDGGFIEGIECLINKLEKLS
jgi:hypothetical protein